jgi:16S rRNA (adenine(1408)-N(1))-methyltransferase
VLAEVLADPDAFVLGIDADARAMADASRRLSRAHPGTGPDPRRAWFLAAGVERLPAELDGLADRVTVRFPWGSLLRGALGLDAAATASIARLVAPDGRLELTLSVVGRDARAVTGLHGDLDAAALGRTAAAFAEHGLALEAAAPLDAADVVSLHSTWARRLRAGADRPAWRVTFSRPVGPVG